MTSATTPPPPILGRAHIEQVVREIFARRAAGDVEGMFRYAAPDLVYRAAGWRVYHDRVVGNGRQESFEIARELNVNLQNLGSEIRELVIDGDRAAVLRRAQIRNRGTGALLPVDIWDFLTFRDGLVVEFEEFPDTAAITALGGSPQ